MAEVPGQRGNHAAEGSRSAFVAALTALALLGTGCGADQAPAPRLPSSPPDSSWVPGQAPLTASAAFLRVAGRAELLGDRRDAARRLELELIQARRDAARRHARTADRRAYERARRLALARFRAALRATDRKRRELDAERRRQREEARKRREALRRKLRVDPGEECTIQEVQAQFDCESGQLPVTSSEE